MPQNKFAIARYRVIDSLLKKHNYVKTSTMVEECIRQTGFRVSRRTIQLDLEAMKYDDFLSFHSPIDYCHRKKAYYYTDPQYSLIPLCFTERDIHFMEYITDTCKDIISREIHMTAQEIILKMKLLVTK